MGQVLVIGLVDGTMFGLFALAITLVYRGTRAVNFALGEIGTVGAYTAWWISVEQAAPWLVGAAGAIAAGVSVSVAFEWLVLRRMSVRSPLAVVVATVALLSFLLGLEFQLLGDSPREAAVPLAGPGITLFDVVVSRTQLLGVAVVAVVAVGLSQFLQRTDFGLGVLAAAQDPDVARLVGVRLRRVTMFVWGAGGAVAVLAALFVAPSVGVLTPGFASSHIFVVALVASVVGGLSSLPGAFLGGLAVGILKSAVLRLFADATLPGKELLVYLLIVVVVLLVRPSGVFDRLRVKGAT